MQEKLTALHEQGSLLSKVVALEALVTEMVAEIETLKAKRGPGRPPVMEAKAA